MPPFSSLFLLHHLRRRPPPLTRAMGGGPRTFPGGLNKWQYKRMHEKLAKEKERKLLYQEKQLYQARLRSEIRASLNPNQSNNQSQPSNFGPMSAKDHIKSLADRFMKAGAEDLWNESDGPIRAKPDFEESSAPLDLRGIVKERRGFEPRRRGLNGRGNESGSAVRSKPDFEANLAPLELRKVVRGMGSYEQRRGYSTWRRGLEEDGDGGLIRLKISKFLESEKGKEEGEGEEDGGGRRMKGSFAALRNHDAKKKRRVPRGDEEEGEGEGFAEQIQRFREEVKSRELGGSEKRMGYKVKEDSVLTQRRFDEFNISPMTIKALNSAGYVQMTVVQEAAVPVCLEGKDALVKARTGTGKTAAFLLPAIEAVLKAANSTSRHRAPPILVLLLAPTRELAIQLAAEANVLLRYHDGIGVQTLIGGTRFKVDQKRLEENPCQIIVATPGRLLDHIENKSGFSVRLMGLKLLILDEADHLLDLGFRKDIEKIVDCIPRQRQSLLFSATIPKEVRRISQVVLKREHEFVDTVGLAVETPAKVMQSYFVAPLEVQFHLVHHLLKEHVMQEFDYKVILFCTTAMGAALMYDLLRHLKMNVREMHSRKPQLYRTRISDEFRESKRLILVTSDVSARGVNYPDVTLVVQVGIPSDREQYIHRLGRTGREGKNGKGILLIAPWEEFFVQEIGDLPIEKYQLPELNSDMKQKVEESITQVDTSIKEAAYHAWLGYYNSISEIGRDKTMLADLATRFSQSIGLEKPPSLFRKTALKMGLKDVPGIRIRK